jgi:hypothetical protein
MELFEVRAGLGGFGIVRILLEESLVGGLGFGSVVQVAKVNASRGKQSIGAIATLRIFTAEKFVLANRVVEGLFIFENAALLREELRDGEDAGVCLGRRWIVMIDGAIEFEDVFIVAPGSLVFGARRERLPGKLGLGIGRGRRLMSRGEGSEACGCKKSQQRGRD